MYNALLDAANSYLDANLLCVRTGAFLLLDDLKNMQIPVGVVSAITPVAQAQRCLRDSGLHDLVKVLCCGSRGFPQLTPSPELHTSVADMLGINRDISIAIEHTDNGIDAAKAAGLLTVVGPDVHRTTTADIHLTLLWPSDPRALLAEAAAPRRHTT